MNRSALLSFAATGLLAATACSPAETPSAAPPPTAVPTTAGEPGCSPFPDQLVADLLASSPTPSTATPSDAVSVATRLSGSDDPVLIVAFTLAEKSVVLAYPAEPGQQPDGSGSFSLTSYTEQVTARPRNNELQDRLDGNAVSLAIDCVT